MTSITSGKESSATGTSKANVAFIDVMISEGDDSYDSITLVWRTEFMIECYLIKGKNLEYELRDRAASW